jgi:N-acetylglutamate synthase-like GNAT family acetyltransferase
MTIAISLFDSRHTDGVRDLIVPIQREEFGIDITYGDQPDLHDIPGFYRKGAGDFWVATANGEVVGSIALIDLGGRRGALRKMFVHSAYRGRDHGVARRLLETLIDHAAEERFTEILLGTTAKFLAAHRFYEKMGFELIDEADLPAGFPRMKVDTRFYRRNLPA